MRGRRTWVTGLLPVARGRRRALGGNLANCAIVEPKKPHIIERGTEIDPDDPISAPFSRHTNHSAMWRPAQRVRRTEALELGSPGIR
jgi:hypothetical protein